MSTQHGCPPAPSQPAWSGAIRALYSSYVSAASSMAGQASSTHQPRSWSKLSACRNMSCIDVTASTFQPEMSSLKSSSFSKRCDMSVTWDVSHRPMGATPYICSKTSRWWR